MKQRETVLILDFGSQYTQLIARRIREEKVYCEILPYNTPFADIAKRRPKALVLSGGPQSVFAPDSPHPDPAIYDFGGPVLGICYGMQLLALASGGRVEPATLREYGKAQLSRTESSPLLEALPDTLQVWMSHGDHVGEAPPGFRVIARTPSAIAAIENVERRRYGLQFHPEVAHTPLGKDILRNFLYRICACSGDWNVASFIEESVAAISRRVGEAKILCALSGGVDSSVAALLVNRAVGDRLTCVFIDNGLLRKNEFQDVLGTFREHLRLNVIGVDASARFLGHLAGVSDPETKRKVIGEDFIRVFEAEAKKIGDVKFLVQGTLYPDVIESVSVKGPSAVIKSHHNVGGLPEKMRLSLVEPLRELFKDEVREVGRELGLPYAFVRRHPFPGPGLAVRIIGAVEPERLEVLREADQIVEQEIRRSGFYDAVWQAFAVLLPVRSVGVMGDGRTYENVIAVRAVQSVDGMTADWAPLPHDLLAVISNRIVNEVRGVNRVVYDISSKPPSTIEWE
jgi:GMP synthase (glutamine-hydrolysing)